MSIFEENGAEKITDRLRKERDEFVVMPLEELVTLLRLFRETVEQNGTKVELRLLDELFVHINPSIIPYGQFGNDEYILTVVGVDQTPKYIDLIKEIRALTSLGLKESKDIVEDIADHAYEYNMLKSTKLATIYTMVSKVRGFGYHVIVTHNGKVIFDSRTDDGSDLASAIPIPSQ